jgi:AcrR family transcriptional regulator
MPGGVKVRQERANRTRRAILEASAEVFQKRGYGGATITEILKIAKVTKGALYFHFASKGDLAVAMLNEQDQDLPVPEQSAKVQELIDTALVHAYRVRTNPLVRAGVRLSMDPKADGVDRSGPFMRWRETTASLLAAAKEQGELLPHVVLSETADIFVGAFAGLQSMSQIMDQYHDLEYRISVLQRHLMPSICVPAVLAVLDFSADRGERLSQQIDEAREREAAARELVATDEPALQRSLPPPPSEALSR